MPRPPDRHRRAAPTAHSRIVLRRRPPLSHSLVPGYGQSCPPAGRERQSRRGHRPSTGWRTPSSLRATARLNAGLLTRPPRPPRGQRPHRSAGAFRPCGWRVRICRFDCCTAAGQRRIPLSRHRICSPPRTRGHKIRVIRAQIEFLGRTGRHDPRQVACTDVISTQ